MSASNAFIATYWIGSETFVKHNASNFAIFSIICLDAIDSEDEKKSIVDSLHKTNKEIIQISEDQANKFAGNMLQVQGDKKYLIMSESAFQSLSEKQISKIESYCSILYSNLKTIEKYGGGSARCMMAEVFLPKEI